MRIKSKFAVILIAVLFVSGLYFICRDYFHFQEIKRQKISLERRKAAWQVLQQKLIYEISQFKGEVGLVIKDLSSDWEISYNKNKLFPSASLVKIPIMAACFLAATEGRVKFDREIVLKNSDKFPGSGILKNVQPGATFSAEELIGLMIYDSDNTATNILTNMVGLDYLNKVFNVWGLKKTNIARKVADFSSRDRGIENYTTAKDMAWLLEQFYHKALISKDISERCLKILKLQRTNDRIPRYLPIEAIVAHKTGLEQTVCHDAGIVFSGHGDFLICVLTKHANSNSTFSKDFIAKIALDTYAYFEQLPDNK